MKATSLMTGKVPSVDSSDDASSLPSASAPPGPAGHNPAPAAPTVALIGCGPSGMFFLHALATRIRSLEEAGDEEALAQLPLVTCYEMSDGPGGMWRSNKKHVARKHNPNMYDTLWTNVPKELTEFADYTYEEHFGGRQTPAFLPRGDVLDYMLKRTTSVDADLYRSGRRRASDDGAVMASPQRLRHDVRYCTTCTNVVYNEATKKFEVTTRDTEWEEENGDDESKGKHSDTTQPRPAIMEQYDYCIWAAGRHGKPRIPRPLLDLLRSGVAPYDEDDQDSISTPTSKEEKQMEPPVPFKGTILHSSHMDGFRHVVNDKRVVLIGDSSSAEDLALKAVHDGAEMVYILSRMGYGDATEVGSWPGTVNPKGKVKPKVKAFIALPYQVVNNGTGLRCCEISWNQDDEIYEIDDEEQPFTLERIDTIIFCTGYAPDLDCLDPSLRFPDHEECFWTAPPNYEMVQNPLSDDVGSHIVPSEELDLSSRVLPGVCRNALMANPKMMYLADANSEIPLFELDVSAWLCLSQITGDTPILGRKDMDREVQQQMLEEMDYPYLRWEMDMNYFEALDQLPDSHWSEDSKDIRSKKMFQKQSEFYTKVVARNMRLGNYPVDFGTFDKLNDDGRKHVELLLASYYARIELDRKAPEAEWKTYRDYDPVKFKSIFTGQEACPLPQHWLEFDGEPISFGKSAGRSSAEQDIEAMVGALYLEASTDSAIPKAPTVAVIGCGPSGMFFLHALATRRKELADANDVNGLASLPNVTCFENADKPGGIWRPQGECKDEAHSPNIYDDCWSNKPKELIEFADYTFQEHFGGEETPVFLPKDDLVDYMMKRTKTVDPNLFDAVRFNTSVNNVVYNSETQKFELQYHRGVSGGTTTTIKEQYDYCIWAAGQHAKPRIPRQLIRLLRTGRCQVNLGESSDEEKEGDNVPFKGTILHSSHTSNFETAVRNKKVVLIGDSDSAEDSALHAVKLGADSIHILSRSGYGVCKETGSWPCVRNKESGELNPIVHVYLSLPYRVIDDGTGLKCAKVEWDQEDEVWERDDETPPMQLDNVDTIIFCTGYMSNQDCLCPELQLKDWDNVWEESFWVVPPGFQMRPNALQPEIGDIEPSEKLDFSSNIIPGVYRNVLIKNPRMMYLASLDNTLLELDIAAWQCLAYVTGDATVPSKEQMEREIQKQMIAEMHIPYLRWEMDMNYFEALDELGDDHWSEDCKDSRTHAIDEEHARYLAKILARNMRSAKYLVDFGSYDSLNEKGERFAQLGLRNDYARRTLDAKAPEAEWKTYRDIEPSLFRSIHTGQPAAPLPCHWLDSDKDGIKSKT